MKTRAFISWLIGAAVISTIIFSSVLYGEEPVKEYYKSGKLKSEGIYKDGKPEGVFKKYYENGQLESEVVFKKGQYDGLYKNYYENGQVRSEIIFKNGKFNGAAKTYYDDGELQGERIYKDDEYQESGKLQNEGVTGISLRIIDQAAFSLPKTLVKIKGETEAERQFLTKLWQ